jgi:hypothetical protein
MCHGSLPSTSAEQRITLYCGFFPLAAVRAHNTPASIEARREAIGCAMARRAVPTSAWLIP